MVSNEHITLDQKISTIYTYCEDRDGVIIPVPMTTDARNAIKLIVESEVKAERARLRAAVEGMQERTRDEGVILGWDFGYQAALVDVLKCSPMKKWERNKDG